MRADHRPSTTTPSTPTPGDDLADVRRQLEALQARVAELEAERAGPAPATSTTASSTPASAPTHAPTHAPAGRRPTAPVLAPGEAPVRLGRRRAIAGLAGAAAAGTVAALAAGTPAAADDGDELILGTDQTATSPTRVIVTGGPLPSGFSVIDTEIGDEVTAGGVFALARGNAFETAIRATALGDGVNAIFARSEGGAAGFFVSESEEAPGVFAGGFGIGLMAAGVDGQVQLTPETPAPVAFPAARTGTLYMQAGQTEESFIDGTLWACVEDGTPGVWRKLAGHDTAGALHILPSPRRVYDSRPGAIPTAVGPKTPLPAGNVARTLDLKAAASGVPAGATGAMVTVLLVNATAGAGNFTIWANGQPKPTANTLVWGGDAGRFTTLAVTAVDSLARVKVDASLQTHVVIDVVGYFR